MNDPSEERHDLAVQNPDENALEGTAASEPEAVGMWNCEDVDRLVEEAKALALHVSRHGNSLPEGKHEPHEKLLEAIAGITSCRSAENWQELMSAYAKLTALTYKERGVNGRTILDTQAEKFKLGRLFSARNRAMGIGVIFFLSALLCEVSMRWSGKVSDEAALSGFRAVVFLIVDALSGFLVPALWGGIGSCIFLAKRTSDKLFDMAYEEARMRGGIIRIFLGSMLGAVTVAFAFPDFSERVVLGELILAPAMVAFIVGLGVKPVYGAFESLSEELARRFKGSRAERNT